MRHRTPLMGWIQTTLLAIVATLLVSPTRAVENPNLAKQDTSLNRVPDDVSVYYGKFRAGEQIKKIANSRAWAKLVKSPAVQLALKTYEVQKDDPDSPISKGALALEDPQIQDALLLLADMFDDEAFIYADQSFVKTLSFLQKIQRFGQREFGHVERDHIRIHDTFRKLHKVKSSEEREKLFEQLRELHRETSVKQTKRMFRFAAQNLDSLEIPTIIFGSKLSDTKRADENLHKLEFIAQMAQFAIRSQLPEADFSNVLTREEINGSEFIVITVSGKMIPWEADKNLMKVIKEDENARKVIEKIKGENLVIAAGVQGDYLLVSIGSSLDELKRFGKGTPLVSRPEMARLEPYADKPFTEITYLSKELMTLTFAYKKDADVALKSITKNLNETKLPEAEKAQALADVTKIATEVKSILPEPGAIASISYMIPTGQEQYLFSWATGGPNEKPLELLNHLGGSPILGFVGICPLDVEKYDMMVGWVDIAWRYFQRFGVAKMSEGKQAEIKEAVELFGPILAEFHKTTREKFLPAFGGEFAIQADADLTLSNIPEVNKPMPMLEPAIILSVKDADLMGDALESYWKTFGDALAAAATKNKHLAKVKLPEPETVEGDAGKRCVFDLPKRCPVHGEIRPTVGLGRDTLVFAATPEAAERLMKKNPLAYSGVLTDAKKPRIAAACFAWNKLLTAAKPWVMFAVEEGLKELPEDCPLTPDAVRKQAEILLEVLSTVRTVTFESYRDGKVTIQHSQVEIKDID